VENLWKTVENRKNAKKNKRNEILSFSYKIPIKLLGKSFNLKSFNLHIRVSSYFVEDKKKKKHIQSHPVQHPDTFIHI
jgi:hypothetical protein